MRRIPVSLVFPVAALVLVAANLYVHVRREERARRTDERAKATFTELIERVNLKEMVQLRVGAAGTYAHREKSGTIEIGFNSYKYRNHSDLAIKGVLAHELGHVIAGHTDTEQPEDSIRQAWRQAQATAIGMCLAGPEATAAWIYDWSKKDKTAADEHFALASVIYANHVTADCRLKTE